MATPRFTRSRNHRFERYTAGTITLNSTSWADVPSISTKTVEAQVGDVLAAEVLFIYGSEGVNVYMGAVTSVSGTPTNSFATGGAAPTSTTGDEIRGWVGLDTGYTHIAGRCFYTVQAGDILAGQVTVRFRYRTGTAADKTIYSSTDSGIFFAVANLGPQDD